MEDIAKIENLIALAMGELNEDAARLLQTKLADPAHAALRAQFEEIQQLLGDLRADGAVSMTNPPADLLRRASQLLTDRTKVQPLAAAASWIDEGLQHAGRIIAELVFDSRNQLAGAGFRGTSGTHMLRYDSTAGNVEMQLTPIKDAVDTRWQVRGCLSSANAAGRSVTLVAPGTGENVADTTMDAGGNFAIVASAGEYDVRIDLDPDPLVLPKLALG